MMYTWIRRLHLYTAFSLAVFVVMYFVTGYVLTRHGWFKNSEPVRSSRVVTLERDESRMAPDEVAFAAWLQERCELAANDNRRDARMTGVGGFSFIGRGSMRPSCWRRISRPQK